MTNITKANINGEKTELERLQAVRGFVLENHSSYLTNLRNATHSLMHGLHLTEGNRQTLESIITKCELGALRTRREVSELDKEIAKLLK